MYSNYDSRVIGPDRPQQSLGFVVDCVGEPEPRIDVFGRKVFEGLQVRTNRERTRVVRGESTAMQLASKVGVNTIPFLIQMMGLS